MPVAIAGMHRAGTSMVARILRMCGLDLGGDEHFAPPAPDNTEGYWEDLRFLAWNERILEAFEGAWDAVPAFPPGWPSDARLRAVRDEADALAASRPEPWGWKDPRTSLTAPFWISRMPDLRFVVCVRHPLEVAGSLRARGYTSERYGLRLWEAYHRALDDAVPPERAIVTHYDSYFVDAPAEIDRMLEFVGLEPIAPVRRAAAESASGGARHQRRASRELDRLSADARRLYESLCERGGPVLARVPAQGDARGPDEAALAVPPERHDPAAQVAVLQPLLAAREEELAAIRPLLAAREEELASVKFVLGKKEEELAAIRPVVAARDEELASVKYVLAARDEELANVKPLLAAREAELHALKNRGS
ncbi:MAG TPA: sulfotransferase [Vicinamibacteria bacterium]|nr:sulfotransferase [Vicinamibacteria bacterium]